MKNSYAFSSVRETVGTIVAALIAFDLAIVFTTMVQISRGIDTAHIPFWDAQIRFISHLLVR